MINKHLNFSAPKLRIHGPGTEPDAVNFATDLIRAGAWVGAIVEQNLKAIKTGPRQ